MANVDSARTSSFSPIYFGLEPNSDDGVSCVIHFAVVASSHAATRMLIWASSFILGRVRSRPIYLKADASAAGPPLPIADVEC